MVSTIDGRVEIVLVREKLEENTGKTECLSCLIETILWSSSKNVIVLYASINSFITYIIPECFIRSHYVHHLFLQMTNLSEKRTSDDCQVAKTEVSLFCACFLPKTSGMGGPFVFLTEDHLGLVRTKRRGRKRMQMSIDMSFFLQNVQVALANQQQPHAQFLVEYAIKLAGRASSVSPLSLLDVGIGLHRGCVREGNEDCVLALGGTRPDMQEVFGLFVVCDGMGGHVRGQEAARLAIQNLLEYLLPSLLTQGSLDWEALLREGIQQANRAIYVQNQSSLASHHHGPTTPKHHMGTTLTAALLIGGTAYIANVGDSRTYLYAQGLHRVTRDHSIVASLVEQGLITEEERYTHPERNKITRALGAHPSVEVDTYVLPLPPYAVLLLCSDGLWEMIQDRKIEEKLVSPWATASEVANQFVLCANDAGGTDNIGCIVVQLQRHRDISGMETIALDPVITGPSTKILEKSVSG